MTSNQLLSRLSRADSRLLEPHLQPMDLPARKQLQAPKKRVDQIYSSTTYMQIGGSGQRLPAEKLREAIAASVTLHQVLLHYVHSFMTQTTQTALANGRSKIEERLARWLLMAHDRVDSDEIALTHEFLSVMLGVRRSGVTTALQGAEPTAATAWQQHAA